MLIVNALPYPIARSTAVNYRSEIEDIVSVDSSGEAEVETEPVAQWTMIHSNLLYS